MAERSVLRIARRPGWICAGLIFAVQMLSSLHPDYGYFIDELYYIACAMRPDFGYVDHPPLTPWLLTLSRALIGDSIPAIRLLPALAGGATVWLAVWLTERLGGRSFAQTLAAICVMTAPVLFLLFGIYTMNGFEVLLWTAILCLVLKLADDAAEGIEAADSGWIAIGLLLGIAVLNKHTSLLLAGAIGFGVIASPLRRHLRSHQIWVAAALAVAIVLPNVAWQATHEWASLDFYSNVDRESSIARSPFAVLVGQFESFNPGTFPVWLAGLVFLVRLPGDRRVLGWIAVVLFTVLLFAGKSRPDRIMGIYPLLFAAGAVQLEAVTRGRFGRKARYAIPALAIFVFVVGAAPATTPILSPEFAARYTEAIGADIDMQREVGTNRLLIPLAHRMGSEELVERVTRVVDSLSASEQKGAIFLATGYATASAIEVLGRQGLPPVYSPHNNYWLWGPPPIEPEVVITVGYEPEQLTSFFESIEIRDRAECRYCMGWRQDVPIAIARGLRRPLESIWPELRRYGYSARKLYLLQQAGILAEPASRSIE